MEWLNIVLGALAALFGGLNILQFVFFRSTKKEYEANAEKAATETSDAKHDYLVKRVESMEQLYQKQGEVLDEVRKQVLKLGQDVQERDQRIIQLETENKALTKKVDQLEREVQAYKTISGK